MSPIAFTTPATFVAGNVLTAAQMNTNVRDNVAWIATDSPACRANSSGAFSHNSSGNWLAVTMDSERFDNAAVHSTSSNTARFTVPAGAGGKYLMGCAGAWDSNATGERIIGMGLNGIVTMLGANSLLSNAVACIMTVNTVYSLAAADYVQMCGWQNSGGTRTIVVQANYSPEAFVFWYRT